VKSSESHLAIMELAALIRSGLSSKQALAGFRIQELSQEQQKQFRFIWEVANQSGGQIATALERLGQVFSNQQRQLAELELAFSSPKATANLVLWLPIASMLLGQLLGISALEATLSSRLGVIALGLGALLLIFARIWSGKMLLRARPSSVDPARYLDAVVIGLGAGLPPETARTLADKLGQIQLQATLSEVEIRDLSESMALSRKTGIALTEILSAKADAVRQSFWHGETQKLSKLSVNLMIPLGLAALPAFILLAVVPMGLGLMK
jgi:tight adherence protein B